jgi:signal transduction histidine kinase
MATPPTGRPSTGSAPAASAGERGVLTALYNISTLVGRVDDPAEAMPRILEELVGLFGADSGLLALVNPDTGALVIEYSAGFPPEHQHAALPLDMGLLGWAAFHNRPVFAGDVAYEPRHLPLRAKTRSLMAVPLEIDGHVHGVFALEDDTPHAFGENHLQTMVLLIGEAASVLRRLWHVDHLRRKAGQLEVLSHIGQELAAKLEPEELMETVTRESHRLTHCRIATLQFYDAAERRARLQAIFPAGEWFDGPEREWPLQDCVAGPAITTRKQVEFSNINQPQFADLRDIPARAHVVAVLSTPLIVDNEVAGVLSIFTDRPHRFSNDERRLLRTLADLAAVALQNARLYQRVFQSEESLRQSERLTTLGLLAAEIAHETRNPLTVIRLLFGALNLQFPPGDERNTDVAVIREKLDQLESFVSRVLTLAKAPESLHSRWPLDTLVRETCQLLRLKLHQARVHLDCHPPERAIVVDCHKGQIQQVLLNVILNATQAMPDGGSISISCHAQPGEAHPTAIIDIRDTGHGIPAELRERIFGSFLSGRPDGTGLGLSIAKRIMRSHHGDIEVASTGPTGTTMRISLPLPT